MTEGSGWGCGMDAPLLENRVARTFSLPCSARATKVPLGSSSGRDAPSGNLSRQMTWTLAMAWEMSVCWCWRRKRWEARAAHNQKAHPPVPALSSQVNGGAPSSARAAREEGVTMDVSCFTLGLSRLKGLSLILSQTGLFFFLLSISSSSRADASQ